MSRKTPIHNGILTSDLEANGHKIIGLQADISSEQIVEAVKPELDKLDERVTMVESEVETKASASIVNLLVHRTDALQGSKADKTALESVEERVAEIEENGSGPAVEVVAPNSSAKTGQAADAKATYEALSQKRDNLDLTVYTLEGGTTEYYIADEFLPVTGPDYYDFSKITFSEGISNTVSVIKCFDANGVNFANFRAGTLDWFTGDVVSFGSEQDVTKVRLSVRTVGGTIHPTGGKMITSQNVVAPNSSAKTGQAADAKAVFDRFVQAEQAISGKANNTDLQTLIKKVSDLQDEEAAVPKIPRYSFVNGTLGEEQEGDDGDVYAYLDIAPWKVTHFVADDLLNVDVKIRVGDGGGKMRDCVLTINCASDAPTIKWGYNMFPRTDRETDFACQENACNVYWITEYESGRFVVARWAEVV